jgi:ketosteroid isomerase-like protein
MKLTIRIFIPLLLLAVCPDSVRGAQHPNFATVEQTLEEFVSAFDSLDWPRFRACFRDNATVFHPAPPNQHRTEPGDLDQSWIGVFDRIRKSSGRNSPPYMQLHPTDVRIDHLSPDVALVTFHLEDGEILGRRTVVLQRISGAWKIVHSHASNIENK